MVTGWYFTVYNWLYGRNDEASQTVVPLLPACCLPQLENIGNFVRAITEYGLKPHDIFEANDLFENVNHTQVQSTLIALAGMVRTSSCNCVQRLCIRHWAGCWRSTLLKNI